MSNSQSNTLKHCVVGGNGIIVAADVEDLESLQQLMEAVKDIPGIVGIKIGCLLAMDGLARAVEIVRSELGDSVDIIYDHQKGGTDIPGMGKKFAKKLKRCGVGAAILFPFAGSKTQAEWQGACLEQGLEIMVGGIMTHEEFLRSEGGYIDNEAILEMYDLACTNGCKHFVVPGTKPRIEWVKKIRKFLESKLGVGNFSLHAPGLITQGGDISECGNAAGKSFFPIIGTAIYDHPTIELQRAAATTIAGNFLAQLEKAGGVK